jgi:hypothetical protein
LRKSTVANLILAAALAAIPSFAGAQVDILGSDPLFGGNPATVTFTDFISTVDATFNAYNTEAAIPGAPDGFFAQKTTAAFTGVGVAGGPAGPETDLGQAITVAFSNPILISAINIAFLFDGPEFGDFQEKAVITANLLGGGTATGTLTSVFDAMPTGTGFGGGASIVQLSPPSAGNAAVWALNNPFGAWVTGLTFTAIDGTCGVAPCDNQSDYSIERISAAIPEPSTYAMLLAGLAVIGFMVRKRAARIG